MGFGNQLGPVLKRNSFCLLLLVIVAASCLRWDTEATKVIDHGVLKWERDRWTRDTWVTGYTVASTGMRLAVPADNWTQERQDAALQKLETVSTTRDILAGGMIIWLAVELLREYGKKYKAKAG